MAEITIDEQIAAVRREIGMRQRVYPRWVSQQKMKQTDADHGIEAMHAVLATLQTVKAERAAKTQPSLGF